MKILESKLRSIIKQVIIETDNISKRDFGDFSEEDLTLIKDEYNYLFEDLKLTDYNFGDIIKCDASPAANFGMSETVFGKYMVVGAAEEDLIRTNYSQEESEVVLYLINPDMEEFKILSSDCPKKNLKLKKDNKKNKFLKDLVLKLQEYNKIKDSFDYINLENGSIKFKYKLIDKEHIVPDPKINANFGLFSKGFFDFEKVAQKIFDDMEKNKLV